MKAHAILQRVAAKLDIPVGTLSQMIAGELPFPDPCMTMPGSHVARLIRRKHTGSPEFVKPYSHIGDQYGHKYMWGLVHPGPVPKLRSACGNTLCVNPTHWFHISALLPEPPPITASDAPWTYEEAEELVELYLENNRYPLNPAHDLLCDIPAELLQRFQR